MVKSVISSAYDSSYAIIFSLAVLSIPSIFIGYLTRDMIIGMGSDFWGNAIFILPENMNIIDAEFIEYKFKILPVCLSMLGASSSFFMYTFHTELLFKLKTSFIGKKFYNFFNKKWFFDKIYNEYITQALFKFSYSTSYKLIDRGIIEIFGPMGLTNLISKNSLAFTKLQTGFLYHYTFIILIVCTVLLGLNQFWFLFSGTIDLNVFIIFSMSILFYIFSNKSK